MSQKGVVTIVRASSLGHDSDQSYPCDVGWDARTKSCLCPKDKQQIGRIRKDTPEADQEQ
eukprot:5182036-Amphidinium_carterae.1